MRAGRRYHQGSLGELLAADIAEVNVVGVEPGEGLVDAGGEGLGRQVSGQDANRLGQAADAEDFYTPDDSRLPAIVGRHQELADAAFLGFHRHGQDALGIADAAVQCQLAGEGPVLECIGAELTRGHQQAQGDREIEAAGILGQVGGCEIDDGAARMPAVAQVGHGPLDAMHALLDRHLGQADQYRLGQAERGIHFYLDRQGVDAVQRKAIELGEHARQAPGPGKRAEGANGTFVYEWGAGCNWLPG